MTGPIAVLGGGIAGLTVAFHLRRAGLDVVLLESSPRFGGVIQTHLEDGWLFEFGPNTVLANHPSIDRLVEMADLEPERLSAGTVGATRYILKGGRLVPLPTTPPAFLASPVFSLGAKLRVCREPFVPRFRGGEETIAAFTRRRLGREMLDYAVGPFVSGVYAGDPEKLSVRYAVRKIHALEERHGSLIRGAIALSRKTGSTSVAPRGGMLSFRRGLAVLPERLGALLGAAARLETTVDSVERGGGGFLVHARGASGEAHTIEAASVVVALDSLASARVLAPLDPDGAIGVAGLADIPYAAVAVTALGFRREQVEHPLDGFGFLAPRREGIRHLGCLFVSSLFPGRAPDGFVALTAICGGATDPEAAALPDERLLSLALDELTPLLGLKGRPVFVRSVRWPRAIPQYNLGHGRFVGVAAGLENRHPGLHVACNWRHGVSVADGITAGTDLADRLAASRLAAGGPLG